MLLPVLIALAAWDFFTTFYGVLGIFHRTTSGDIIDMVMMDPIKTIASLAVATAIMLVLLSAKTVLENGWQLGFRVVFVVAFIYDAYTSYMGNLAFILRVDDPKLSEFFVIIGLTIFVSGSTSAIPYLIKKKT
jgi:hypothetical protein